MQPPMPGPGGMMNAPGQMNQPYSGQMSPMAQQPPIVSVMCSFPICLSKIFQKDSPHQNVFKLTLSQKSFYVFRKDRQCKFIFLLSPSLDLLNIISVRALEAMKVAGETLQRSQPLEVCLMY